MSPEHFPDPEMGAEIELPATTSVDPYRPSLRSHSPSRRRRRTRQSGRLAQRERRSRILAAARTLLGQGGLECCTVKALSEVSHVSIQTIYNLVGNRLEVVEEAINEHIYLSISNVFSLETCPNIFLGLADLTWLSAARYPGYVRQATLSCEAHGGLLSRRVLRRQASHLTKLLHREYAPEARLEDIDLDALAQHMTTLSAALAVQWANGCLSLNELRYQLATSRSYMLSGLLTAREKADISSWIGKMKFQLDGSATPVTPY